MEVTGDLETIIRQIELIKDMTAHPFKYGANKRERGERKSLTWTHLISNIGDYVRDESLRLL